MDDPIQILGKYLFLLHLLDLYTFNLTLKLLSDNETQIFPSRYVACNRRWLNYRIKILVVRLDGNNDGIKLHGICCYLLMIIRLFSEYTIELKLMTFINGERRCIRIIPSSAKLVRLFNIINDMVIIDSNTTFEVPTQPHTIMYFQIPVIVNQNIENDLSFPNDCKSVHILVSQPEVKPTEITEKLSLSPEKADISDGSFSIASRFPGILIEFIFSGP